MLTRLGRLCAEQFASNAASPSFGGRRPSPVALGVRTKQKGRRAGSGRSEPFRRARGRRMSGTKVKSPIFELNAKGVRATAREQNRAFIVQAGSTARREGTDAFPARCRKIRDQLVKTRVIVKGRNPCQYRFKKNVPFRSPTAAAAVVLARNASGPQEWKLRGTAETYKVWYAARLAVLGKTC
jgi:hypothetical protein